MRRLKRAFHVVEKQQQKVTHLERETARFHQGADWLLLFGFAFLLLHRRFPMTLRCARPAVRHGDGENRFTNRDIVVSTPISGSRSD